MSMIVNPRTPYFSEHIFNFQKKDYVNPPLFLGEAPGLFDTVNKAHPKVWELYKTMKSLDWDELEFDYSSCNVEFKTLPSYKTDMMIKSLAWQWETDSIASRSIAHIVSLFNPCPELWAAWQEVSKNEVVHASTYSEVVRSSFDNPREVLDNILADLEPMHRLQCVGRELTWIRERGLRFAMGEVANDQDTYNAMFMFAFVMYVLERLQFMASFAVTFALGEENHFIPICKAIQKIAQDEYEVHVELDITVLEIELRNPRGQLAYQQMKPRMERILQEVLESEYAFTEYVMPGNDQLKNLNRDGLKSWVLFSASDIARTFSLDLGTDGLYKNPLHYMSSWMKISDTQPSPQEEANGQYKVGIMVRDDDEVEFDLGF